jgi:transcriptional regulator with XRE-family HTH domain
MSFDFIAQIERELERKGISQAQLADLLGVSESAVSKVLNNPQNLTLKTIASYSFALGVKAGIVAYDDHDAANQKGLVPSGVFNECWNALGCPRDSWQMEEARTQTADTTTLMTNVINVYPGYRSLWPNHSFVEQFRNETKMPVFLEFSTDRANTTETREIHHA